jgi:hypothetical protein
MIEHGLQRLAIGVNVGDQGKSHGGAVRDDDEQLQRKCRRYAHPACQNSRLASHSKKTSMDIERINLIGTNLADLTRRTEALRGYL